MYLDKFFQKYSVIRSDEALILSLKLYFTDLIKEMMISITEGLTTRGKKRMSVNPLVMNMIKEVNSVIETNKELNEDISNMLVEEVSLLVKRHPYLKIVADLHVELTEQITLRSTPDREKAFGYFQNDIHQFIDHRYVELGIRSMKYNLPERVVLLKASKERSNEQDKPTETENGIPEGWEKIQDNKKASEWERELNDMQLRIRHRRIGGQDESE